MRGIIYDLDGVIVDTAKYHYLGWKKLADELGVPFDEARNEKLKGVSRRESLLALLGSAPAEDRITELCERKNGYYLQFVSSMDRGEILPGALAMLDAAAAAGYKQAIASASRNARLILGKLGLADRFDAIVDGNDAARAKPAPDLFLIAAERLGLGPDDVVVFEDSEAGIEAACAGHMRSIGLGSPANLGRAHLVVPGLHAVTLRDVERLFSSNQRKEKIA